MKRLILSLAVVLILLPSCGQTDKKVISIVQNGFPLTYKSIDKNARDKWGDNQKRIDATILNECECFVLVGNMLINPERSCDVDKRAFGTFFVIATLENTYVKDLTPEKLFECISCTSFDERFSCMDLNWHGVLKSLVKQIMEYKIIKEKEEKTKNTLIV
jgi:hypothetical protein